MIGWRKAVVGDDGMLLQLERACGLEALGHVFPPDAFPYPDDHVRARWQRRLRDPEATTVFAVDSGTGTPVGFVCVRAAVVEHLGVHPARQRRGVGRLLLDEAERTARAEGAVDLTLWCLAENHRALQFYDTLGWAPTGRSRAAEFAPHPEERQLGKALEEQC